MFKIIFLKTSLFPPNGRQFTLDSLLNKLNILNIQKNENKKE